MEQYQHTGKRLKLNHCNALPRYIVAFDTETTPTPTDSNGKKFTHRWRLATAVYCRMRGTDPSDLRAKRFKHKSAWWEFLKSLTGPRHTVWCIAHNALFDLVVAGMPELFYKSELVIDFPRTKRKREDNDPDNVFCHGLTVIESPPTIIGAKFPDTEGRIVFVDSLNWFPETLSSLGESAGIPKFPMPRFDQSDEDWFRYCERDSQIVFTTFLELIRWVKSENMGMFRYTGPSQAMAAYRHKYMQHEIFLHDNAQAKQLERKAYFGGRTEVFRLGKVNQTVHQLDVNALYPSVMASQLYPCKLKRFEFRKEYLELRPDIDWGASVAEVELSTPDALFPIRSPDIILYPTGEFRACLCGQELAYAHRKGYIRACRSWAEYELAPLFTSWVAGLWAMRQHYKANGNRLYASFAKKLMNSLYGKFGQLAHEWVPAPDALVIEPWSTWVHIDLSTGKRTQFRSFGWTASRQIERRQFTVRHVMENGKMITELDEESCELQGTFPAISAFVTAAGRMRMNALRNIAGARQVFYQGVDGLIVTSDGLARLKQAGEVDDDEIGKLRLELSTDDGDIIGCSDYTLADKIVLAGRARTWNNKESGEILQRKFSVANHLFRGVNLDHVTEESQPWHRKSKYAKGIVGDDGWIYPFPLVDGVVPGMTREKSADSTASAIAVTVSVKSGN